MEQVVVGLTSKIVHTESKNISHTEKHFFCLVREFQMLGTRWGRRNPASVLCMSSSECEDSPAGEDTGGDDSFQCEWLQHGAVRFRQLHGPSDSLSMTNGYAFSPDAGWSGWSVEQACTSPSVANTQADNVQVSGCTGNPCERMGADEPICNDALAPLLRNNCTNVSSGRCQEQT